VQTSQRHDGRIESLVDVKEFIKEGVTFGGMLHKILEISCENRLNILYHRQSTHKYLKQHQYECMA
jgi:hypothetical protein